MTRFSRVVPLALALVFAAPPLRAQTDAELSAARTLFAEALRDQDQKHFDVALEKFRRVQQVRDTAPIRYRIGLCHEGLGHLGDALAAYQGAVDAAQKDRTQDDVIRASRARMDVVSKRMPHLSLSLSGRSPSEVDLRVDDRRIAPESLKEAVPVEVGEHVITATAPGSKPFRTVVFLPEGGTAALMIPLDGESSVIAAMPPPARDGQAGEGPATPGPSAGNDAPTGSASSQRTVGIVVTAGGVALAAGAGVVYLLRRGAIADLKAGCPDNVCPVARQAELSATHDRAAMYGPLAIGLGVAGVAALGIGSYLFVSAPSPNASSPKPTARVLPLVTWGAAGLALTGDF